MSALTPSRVARRLAGDLWPDVQSQERLVAGVFRFDCAGHGGTVAVLDFAKVPAGAVELAYTFGKVEWVGLHGRQLLTSEHYTAETFTRMRDAGCPVFPCWVGEEDCDWALLTLTVPGLAAAEARRMAPTSRYASAAGMLEYARENAGRWNPGFLAAWDAAEARRSLDQANDRIARAGRSKVYGMEVV